MEGYKEDKEFADIFWTLPQKIQNMTRGSIRWTGSDDAVRWIKANCASIAVDANANSRLFRDMMVWCEETLGDNFVWNFNTIYFKDPRAKTMFTLRWSSDLTTD